MKHIIIIAALSLSLATNARDWGRVLKAIAYIESKNDPKAVSGDQVGLLQIRPIMVKDCNRILERRGSAKRYTLRDRYNPVKSREMFILYQSHYNPNGNIERAIRLWNGGSGYSVRGTQIYYQKVKKAMRK
jgi:soluble lytic murein transglycosylase-like protein